MMVKIPVQAFGAHGLHCLKFFDLPSLQSLRVLNIASLARAANRTLTAWKTWFKLLVKSAESHLSPESIALNQFCKPFWDSVPFVCNLHLYDLKNPLALQHLVSKSVRSVDAPHGLASVCPMLGSSWKSLNNLLSLPIIKELKDAGTQPKPQIIISNILKPVVHKMSWLESLACRLRAFCSRNQLGQTSVRFVNNFDRRNWKSLLCKLSPFAKSHILRTMTNSRITSHRIPAGKDKLHCYFCGRNGLDSLGHIVSCSTFLEHIRQVTGMSGNLLPVYRLGLTLDLCALSCVSFANYYYHVVKHSPHSCNKR